MKNIKLYFACAAAFILVKAHGQPQVPVDPFTGKAQVAIPIWTLKTNSIEAPIVLSNTGGGMKVTEGEGNAGIGWNVIAGGSVSREVRGLPDDFEDVAGGRRGWLNGTNASALQGFTPIGDNNLLNCTDENTDLAFLNSLQDYTKNDTEPDLFNFSAPGISGQFFFDGNKALRLAPYQDLKVEYVLDLTKNITSFTITRNDGVRYTFDRPELTTRQSILYKSNTSSEYNDSFYKNKLNFNSSWKLGLIADPGNKTVSFNYSYDNFVESNQYKRFVRSGTSIVDTLFVTTDLVNARMLTSTTDLITTVHFARNSVNKNLITSISIAGGSKSFSFTYEHVRNSGDLNSVNLGKRYFLREFREVGPDCYSFPSYKFEYYDVDLVARTTSIPIKNGFAQDLWGYYNGATDVQGSLVPTLYYKDAAEGAERLRINLHPADPGYTTIAGANRAVNPVTVHYGSLKRIYYPPGGYAQLTYEPADYYDSLANTTYPGGGVRVAEVRMSTGEAGASDIVTTYQYKRLDNHSSGKFLYPPQFGWFAVALERSPDNLAINDDLLYSRVTMKQTGLGKTIYQYSIPGTFQQATGGDWTAPFTRIARAAAICTPAAPYKNGYFVYPFTSSTNFSFERGLISKIFKYNEANELLQETSFQYSRIGPGAAYTKVLKIASTPSGPLFTSYKLISNISKLTIAKTDKVYDPQALTSFITTTSSYTYDPAFYLLRSNAIINSDNSIRKTKFKYAKDFATITNPSGTFAIAVNLLNASNRHGVVLESIQSNQRSGSSEVITGSELTLYNQYANAGGLVLPSEKQIFAGTTGFVESYIFLNGTVQEIRSGGYRPVSFIDEYDNNGNVLTQRDGQRNVQSALYTPRSKSGTNGFYPLPRAVISNARYDEVVHNLFDFVDINVGGNPVTSQTYVGGAATPHHTGQLAMTLAVATTLAKDNVVKKSNSKYYRFTARVRAATAVNLTVRALNGAVIKSSAVVPVAATAGAWKFVEGQLDMSTVTSPFKLELANSAPIDYDEISFYPANANINSSTYHLLFGKLSETNSKGVSSFIEYDNGGRVKYLRDQDKNVLQVNEYQYKSKPSPPLVASYACQGFSVGAPTTFIATSNCLSNVTYTWYVNCNLISYGYNLTTFTYSFIANDPIVRLEVSLSGQDMAVFETIQHYNIPISIPPPTTCAPSISIALTGSSTLLSCSLESFDRTFTSTVTNTANCGGGPGLRWQYLTETDNDWNNIFGVGSTFNFNFTAIYSVPQSVQIRCLAIQPASFETLATSNVITLGYVDQGTCR